LLKRTHLSISASTATASNPGIAEASRRTTRSTADEFFGPSGFSMRSAVFPVLGLAPKSTVR